MRTSDGKIGSVASELKESDLKQRLFIASKTVRPTQK
jgi:hypothetical protein